MTSKNRFITELSDAARKLQELSQLPDENFGGSNTFAETGIEFDFELPYSSLPALDGRMWKKTETVC